MNLIKQYKFILYQITRPISYLYIKHEDKYIYDWLIPAIFSLIVVIASFYFIPLKDIFGTDGLISQLTDFVANLPGFFIAALAAVATFSKPDIDKKMANPPKIEIFYQGNLTMVDMTRRRFLCVLFSYLTAVSIFLVISARFCLSIVLPSEYFTLLSWVGTVVFMFVFWQMITATLLGLYYLGERLHTPE